MTFKKFNNTPAILGVEPTWGNGIPGVKRTWGRVKIV